jgi:hypothetical protein
MKVIVIAEYTAIAKAEEVVRGLSFPSAIAAQSLESHVHPRFN